MVNKIDKAFHPGLYLRGYLEELQITQDEFAKRLDISGKQLSLILNESASITADIAYKLSKLIGTSMELWLNMQSGYDAYKVKLAALKEYEEEKNIYRMVDKSFLGDLGIINKDDNINDAIPKLREASLVSSLLNHKQKDIFSFHTVSSTEEKIENTVCKNVWVSIASLMARKEEVAPFNETKLLSYVDTFKKMTKQSSSEFYPEMKRILNECGVAFVILPPLKKSNVSGVVKWFSNDKVMMAINTKGSYNDRFWYVFFHELKHIFQKVKRKMITDHEGEISALEAILEYEADAYANETLIPSEYLKELENYEESSIITLSDKYNIHPGIVVGRLQKDNKIKHSQLNHLKERIEININCN